MTSCSSGYKTNSKTLNLSDEVRWCNVNQFLSYSKNYICNLYKSIYDIINYTTSIYPFKSGKCGKERTKLQRFEYLENEKSFLDEMKNIFPSF